MTTFDEAARLAKLLDETADDCEDMSRWAIPEIAPLLRECAIALRAHPAGTQDREALRAAIRAAKLALFVINKQGVMPNSSWQSGFDADLKMAEAALALPPTPIPVQADAPLAIDPADREFQP